MTPAQLDPTQSLEAYFYEAIHEAQDRGNTRLSDDVEAYLVYLLSCFARRTGVAGRKSEALATQYLSACSHAGAARNLALRSVGDRALFITGVVPHSLHRTPVNLRYVRSIGSSAYGQISGGNRGLAVFDELAEKFEALGEVISDTLETQPPSQNLMELYERWRKFGSSRDARRLAEAGVRLDPAGADILQ
ncbi:MAG: hypothetical protein ACPG4T_20930 [Nannocystaceae bacterium]